jgi:tRNA (cytidine/uridine-2'-O-)-methyltransferase
VRLVLYQPDIPQNLGAAIRLSACFGAPLEVIEPCGFALTDSKAKRAALDYGASAQVNRHASWADFLASPARGEGRLVLLTTKGADRLDSFVFAPGDLLLLGRESAGVPDEVAAAADSQVRIPLRPGARSLNMANAASIALYAALRATGSLPD